MGREPTGTIFGLLADLGEFGHPLRHRGEGIAGIQNRGREPLRAGVS
jgi:hypothetical protein